MSEHKLTYKCDALVDQGRTIGDEPVGYRCSREATMEAETGQLLCDECAELWNAGSPRITFFAYGREYQERMYASHQAFIAGMTEQGARALFYGPKKRS